MRIVLYPVCFLLLLYLSTSVLATTSKKSKSFFAPGFNQQKNGLYGNLGDTSLTTLPVRFMSFSARKWDANVELIWSVEEEDNIDHYEIEKSEDGKFYQKIGSVTISENQRYLYREAAVYFSAYYRIKAVDKDEEFSFSSILYVKQKPAVSFRAYPSPAKDEVRIQHQVAGANERFQLLSIEGVLLSSVTPQKGTIETVLHLSGIKPGTYLLRHIDDKNKNEVIKIVKL